MLFDAGKWGIVEVDQIIEMSDANPPYVRGIKNPDDFYNQITYDQYGPKLGCCMIRTHPPVDRSPETRQKNRAMLIHTCERVWHRLETEQAFKLQNES